jgi:RNA polymerase sigma factor (sigma-70 family)
MPADGDATPQQARSGTPGLRAAAYTDRVRAAYIPRAGSRPGAGINRASRQSLEQAMPHQTFEEVVLPHLDAAFNYARWLTRSDADAEDVVQDAYVRALRFFSSLRSDDARAWLLTIVRNTWYGRFSHARAHQTAELDNTEHDPPDDGLGPEALAMQQQAVENVQRAIQELPVDFREVIVLRELEGLSYKEIAAVVGIPIGTVMSRLARARERLLAVLEPSAARTGGSHRDVR